MGRGWTFLERCQRKSQEVVGSQREDFDKEQQESKRIVNSSKKCSLKGFYQTVLSWILNLNNFCQK